MTKLHCSAVHCQFNKNSLCCRSGIHVDGGHEACAPHQTSCASFCEQSNAPRNRAETFSHPDDQSNVDCSATQCEYNQNRNCVAKAIKIGGTSAYRSCDTECNTFSCGGPCKTHCK